MDYGKIIRHMGDVRPSNRIEEGVDISVTCRFDVDIDPPGTEGREYVENTYTITLKRNLVGVCVPVRFSAKLLYDAMSFFQEDCALLEDLCEEILHRGAELARGKECSSR